jgi:hypothetical protein
VANRLVEDQLAGRSGQVYPAFDPVQQSIATTNPRDGGLARAVERSGAPGDKPSRLAGMDPSLILPSVAPAEAPEPSENLLPKLPRLHTTPPSEYTIVVGNDHRTLPSFDH